ncbi:MAG: hypothetical protein ACJAX5_002739 [Patiriisocius sp.]|jgi:hypothetical protein
MELRLNALAGDLHIEAGEVDQIKIEGVACSDETPIMPISICTLKYQPL